MPPSHESEVAYWSTDLRTPVIDRSFFSSTVTVWSVKVLKTEKMSYSARSEDDVADENQVKPHHGVPSLSEERRGGGLRTTCPTSTLRAVAPNVFGAQISDPSLCKTRRLPKLEGCPCLTEGTKHEVCMYGLGSRTIVQYIILSVLLRCCIFHLELCSKHLLMR